MKKRKDGRWCKTVTIEGKRLFFYSSETTEKKADRDIAHQMAEYTRKEEQGRTFQEVANEWEEEHFPTLEHYTERRYKTLSSHAVDEFQGFFVRDITPEMIERFLKRMSVKRYATKTIKDQFSVIKLIFKYAIINGYISSDPTQYLRPPKGKESEPREAITNEEMDIIKHSTGCTFGVLAYFLMYTGLRKGEALALQWKDINFSTKEISISKSVCHHNNKPMIKTTKTRAGIRKVALLDCVANEIKKLPMTGKDGYIFSGSSEPLTNSQFQCRWEKFNKETGLSITAHQLRHTYATILFEAGINVKDAQNMMGHSDITVTQNIYTHIRKERSLSTIQKLNNYICGNDDVSTCSQGSGKSLER